MVVEATDGIARASEPSLGVLLVMTLGYVKPPSVDIVILTLATLNGAAFVPTMFHVIVCVEPAA